MGAFAAKDFERNDYIEGQGKGVLLLAKRFHLSKNELDRIFHEFRKYEDPVTHKASISTMFEKTKAQYSLICSLIFQLYDIDKSGLINFQEYLVIMWGFLSADQGGVAKLCFQMFDIDRLGSLDASEVKYLINVLWEFNPSKGVNKAISKVDQNQDSVITEAEFILLCRHHLEILTPLLKVQKAFRKVIVHKRFWNQLEERRYELLKYKSVIELRGLDNYNVSSLTMEYLNLRTEVVPRKFVEQWRHVQKKKATSYRGNIELPYELKDKLNSLENTASWSPAGSKYHASLSEEQSSYVC